MLRKMIVNVALLGSMVIAQTSKDDIQSASLDERIALLEQLVRDNDLSSHSEPKVSFPGQYRINFYSVDNNRIGEDQQNAARLRMRQNVDILFNERLKTSLRLQLNHTNDNVTNAGDINGNDVQVRHAYIDYKLTESTQLKTGLVPVMEYQNDLLYSKDWGYNPFALEGFSRFDALTLHYFAAQLSEGSETNSSDDTLHYQGDLIYDLGKKGRLIGSVSIVDIHNGTNIGIQSNYALKGEWTFPSKTSLTVSAMHSQTDKALLGLNSDAMGDAFLLELKKAYKICNLGLLATHASGESDGSGFLVPMSFTGTTSYWGYMGTMTVLYETDTGFASDSVHVSNNGYGMTSVQAKAEFVLSADHKLYLSAGWFGNSHALDRSSVVGRELFLMDKYAFNKYLSLHTGVSYAELYDSLSGYGLGVTGGSNFNQSIGVTRYKTALFGRVQLAF